MDVIRKNGSFEFGVARSLYTTTPKDPKETLI
jgi:hypothetical protein